MTIKILVTGGAGFIGSTLISGLLEEFRDVEVVSLDNNFRYNYSFLRQIKDDRLKLVKGDICDYSLLNQLLPDTDFIVHLAAIPGERLCKPYASEAFRTNIYGTYVLFEHALKNRIKNIIFASSQVVYGAPKYVPVDEKHPKQPYDIYSFTKIANEIQVKSYLDKGLEIITFRFSSVYGYGLFARWSEVSGKFARNVVERKPLTIYKPPNINVYGGQVIDFIHVKDICNGIISAIKKFDDGKNDVYNLAYGKGFSIREFAEKYQHVAKKYYDIEVSFKYVETNEPEIPKYEISNQKVKDRFNWRPKITLEEGIINLIENYKKTIERYGEPREPVNLITPPRTME